MLIGWAADIDLLKRIAPGLVAMNPATAACFVLAGIGLCAAVRQPRSRSVDGCVMGIGAIVCGIGLLRVLGYVFNIDVGIDHLLFSQRVDQDLLPMPNRMAPNTAMCFALCGAALATTSGRSARMHAAAQGIAACAGAMAMLAMLGYLYSVAPLYGVAAFIPMAVHTAAGFLIVSLGLLTARPDCGVMKLWSDAGAAGIMVRRMLLPVIFLPVALGWLRVWGERGGLYGSEFGAAATAIAYIVVLSTLVIWSARLLQRTDRERRSAEEAVQKNRQLLQSIIDNTAAVVFVKDLDGRYLLVNRRFETVVNAAAEHVPGKTDYELFPKHLADGYRANDQAAIAAGKVIETEEQAHHPAGARTYLSMKAPLLDGDGQAYAICGVWTDITERIAAQQLLRSVNAQLEQRVRERTAELSQLVEELQQFASVASHDLQEPLRKVRAFADRLRLRFSATLGEQGNDYLQRMDSAAERMQTLINDLLSLSRVTSKGRPFAAVDLGQIVREALEDLETRIEQTGATVQVGALPVVQADGVQMRQLMQNLLANALKFHRAGVPPVVSVSARTVKGGGETGDGGGELCEITVQDNGIGFEPQYAQRIFAPFEKLHSRGEFEGTGMGLAICRKIVQRHRGEISAQASPGAGATFTARLPIHQPGDEPCHTTADTESRCSWPMTTRKIA